MNIILNWGYEAPVKNDYIKDQRQLMYKIRKMGIEKISEKTDNYRKPEFVQDKGVYLFNFMGTESQEKWKRKLYDMAVEGESEKFKHTTYKALLCNDEKAWWDHVFQLVTPAGKTSYKPNPKSLVTPMDFVKQKIEDRVRVILEKMMADQLAE